LVGKTASVASEAGESVAECVDDIGPLLVHFAHIQSAVADGDALCMGGDMTIWKGSKK
jgi:hypothetical protein